MERDQQIGLALAVLLAGIVGAFFFRNEPVLRNEAPELENPRALDAQIAEQPLVPYLTGIEVMDPVKTGSGDQILDLESLTRPDASPLVNPDFPLVPTTSAAIPAGTATESKSAVEASRPIHTPSYNDAWQAVPDPSNQVPASTLPVHQSEFRTCVVQPGDTLSGLAARYLGSGDRFLEIYELNRDLLTAPDKLQVGMLLKLPSASPAVGVSPPMPGQGRPLMRAGPNGPHSDPPAKPPDGGRATGNRGLPGSGQLQLLPSTPAGNQGTTAATPFVANPNGRTLSQVPPPDYPGFQAVSVMQPNLQPVSTPGGLRQHTVGHGETLEGIAVRYYGDRSAAARIFAANQRQLSSPNAIREGMTLILP